MKKGENYKYLLRLYELVDEYLSDISDEKENLPEIIVAFCVVTEKILKIKLHKKNPVLVFENAKFKEDDAFITILKKKELNIETIKINDALNRHKLMFKKGFSDDEIQVIIDIYRIRNHFVHGYKADNDIMEDKENIVKKMGTVWEKISTQAISLFGKTAIKTKKPKKKYSEEELELVLTEEVRKKIKNTNNDPFSRYTYIEEPYYGFNEECPRCGYSEFSKDDKKDPLDFHEEGLFFNRVSSSLYRCKNCHLELTNKEYEIAKKIKSERKFKMS